MASEEQDWSIPESDVLYSVREVIESDEEAVLATVISVEGSAYRRPGAKMLVRQTEAEGHITAGCLEDEVFDLAEEVLEDGSPRVKTYDLMNDDDDVWGLGVGCDGIIDILLEPVDQSHQPIVDSIESRESIVTLTVTSTEGMGSKAYYDGDEFYTASEYFSVDMFDELKSVAEELIQSGRSGSVKMSNGSTVFLDGYAPDPRIVVFGSGHDVGPVVEQGTKNGFEVEVVSFRGGIDLKGRFPRADSVKHSSPFSVSEDVQLGSDTYAIVMTHNFIDDRMVVGELLRSDVNYIGLMGPMERFEEMLEEFNAEGEEFSEKEFSLMYTPVGLDLGGGSPYQIATSIVGEILAVSNERNPQHLRDRDGHIHERVE